MAQAKVWRGPPLSWARDGPLRLVVINGASTNQPQSLGPVAFFVSACSNGSQGCTGMANNGSIYSFLDAAMSDESLQVQVLLGVRLPVGATPPTNLTAQVSGGGTLTLARSTSYEAELQQLEPAPAGHRWWGWLSGQVTYSRNTAQGFSVSFQTGLPRPSGTGPLPSPMRWRPVVGARFVDPNLPATRAVQCGSVNSHLYDGFGENGANQDTVTCVDSPAPDATRGYLDAAITDFGIVGTTATAPAGAIVTATLIAQRSGPTDPDTTFALSAGGGPPGGSVTIDRTSVPLDGDSATPVLATVRVPAGTRPGAIRSR